MIHTIWTSYKSWSRLKASQKHASWKQGLNWGFSGLFTTMQTLINLLHMYMMYNC